MDATDPRREAECFHVCGFVTPEAWTGGGVLGTHLWVEFAPDGSCVLTPTARMNAPAPGDPYRTVEYDLTPTVLPAGATARDFAEALIAEGHFWQERVRAVEAAKQLVTA